MAAAGDAARRKAGEEEVALTQPRLKPLVKVLREGKIVRFRTENGDWLVFYENKFPFVYEKLGYIRLLHRHERAGIFHQQGVSAWCTSHGLSDLLRYVRQHDFEYLSALNEEVEVNVVDLEEVAADLPYVEFLGEIWWFLSNAVLDPEEEVVLRRWVADAFLRSPFVARDSAVLDECQKIIEALLQDEEKEENDQEGRLGEQ